MYSAIILNAMPDQPVTTQRQKPITLGKLLLVLIIVTTTVLLLWNRFGAGSLIDRDAVVTPTPSATSPTTQPTFGSMGTDEDITEVIIKAESYRFTPNTVTVKQGEKVRLVLESTNGTHDLAIDELGVATQLVSDGHKAWVDFIPDKKGTFSFYCSVSDHRAMGMEGTLVVE